jgi:hypothetical protein
MLLFLVHFTKLISNVMYVSINKKLVSFQNLLQCSILAAFSGKGERCLLIANVVVGSVTHFAHKPRVGQACFTHFSHNSTSSQGIMFRISHMRVVYQCMKLSTLAYPSVKVTKRSRYVSFTPRRTLPGYVN